MKVTRRGLLALATAGTLLVAAVAISRLHERHDSQQELLTPLEMSFDGQSSRLPETQIVPTLDTSVAKGKSIIWCASFVSAWKSLQALAGGAIQLTGAQEKADALNAAVDPAGYIPAGSAYSAAGRTDDGIIETIKREMKGRFPAAPEPAFNEATTDIAAVAYAYLEARAQFTTAFLENSKPLTFTGAGGERTAVRSFGIRGEDGGSYQDLRAQVRVLYYLPYASSDGATDQTEFALDLCSTSEPSQVVVARVPLQESLAATVALVKANTASATPELGLDDVVLVPDMSWRLRHHFSELESKPFGNAQLRGLPLVTASQDITFRLDRRGAEVKSEAKVIVGAAPTMYVMDGPFLVYVKKRESEQPFFVMWVDNAELLQKW